MKYYNLPNISTVADAVILANGDFPTHPIALSILENSRNIICCDGAIDNLSKTNICPDAIVGDCDSLSDENKRKYSSIIHQINEQETNDLTKSVKYCIERGFTNLIILGATGKREDHTIANISLLSEYIHIVENVSIITNYGIFNAIKNCGEFESFEKQQVSLFCISPTKVTVKGLKYPIENAVFTNWWQATLNESIASKFEVESSHQLIVYRVFE